MSGKVTVSENKKPRFPYSLLALDLVGALLVAAGLMNLVGEDPSTEGYLYIGLGFALMFPLIWHFLQHKPDGEKK